MFQIWYQEPVKIKGLCKDLWVLNRTMLDKVNLIGKGQWELKILIESHGIFKEAMLMEVMDS